MSHYRPNGRESQGRLPDVYLLRYANELMQSGRITIRQAILLGYVDKFCSPYSSDYEAEPHRDFHPGHLLKLLGMTDHRSLTAAIEGLAAIRPRVLRARKIDHRWWRLKTKNRDRNQVASVLRIPGPVLAMMGRGLTPSEVVVLSLVASFTLRGQPCFITNQYIADRLGLGRKRPMKSANLEGEARATQELKERENRLSEAKRLVNSLVRKGYLESFLRTHDGMHELLVEHWGEDIEFKRTGNQTSRLLLPTSLQLHPKEPCDEAA